ncbi:flagellar protein FlaG [Pseudomonas sp. PDM16]|uniref:flagellar protein FlaG n=1 Tax=Pseudomonas sp. PDM16 TaxID=2769292 RepID=UPI00177EA286|nr:flagellar protein FlaG [Pseudomonas sp. PDM16]MBD9416510.1 flagellar protein FlaG [Pseudomonas sp. PDM16]
MDVSSIQNSLNPAAGGTKVERSPAGSNAATSANSSDERAKAQSAEAEGADKKVAREDVEAAVATIQDFVQSVRRNINFSLEEGSGRVVVKVTDEGSGDLIRQIPSEEALQLAENLSEVRSLLFKAEA